MPTAATLVVAIDGPSGSGKSSVSRRVASRLGLRYLDTGAMYRAATWAVLRAGVDPQDAAAVAACVAGSEIDVATDPAAPGVLLGGEPVDEVIRGRQVTAAVSAVSAVAEVRDQLVAQQRRVAGGGGIVVEGRDIAGVVLPHAQVKVYLTASEEARASRRHGQTRRQGGAATAVQDVQADLARRDRLDSGRAVSPLALAPGAVELDTTALSLAEVVDAVVGLARSALRETPA